MIDLEEVIHVAGRGYLVRSLSLSDEHSTAFRLVYESDTGWTCSCPAGEKQTCRHRRAVNEWTRARFKPRPSAPPNISALVD